MATATMEQAGAETRAAGGRRFGWPERLLLLTAVGCGAFAAWDWLRPDPPAMLRFPLPLDVGSATVRQGKEATLRIENIGSEPRTILGVRSMCGGLCVGASGELPLTIPPGESRTIPLHFSVNQLGDAKLETELYTDEPGYGIRELAVVARGVEGEGKNEEKKEEKKIQSRQLQP